MVLAVLTSLLCVNSPGVTTDLSRVFRKGERVQYEVNSHLLAETRAGGLSTFMPEDTDFEYRFAYQVTDLLADGIALAKYQRPTMTITESDGEGEPERKVEKVNLDLEVRLSPINELLNVKDLGKKTPPKDGIRLVADRPLMRQPDMVANFVLEVHRLALFLGSLDSSLDFAPKLPFEDVAPGATWKRTVGYQPQRLGSGKSAVQRLDLTYTYRGPTTSNGKPVLRVTADLDLDTDVAAFANQLYGTTPEESGLFRLPLRLKAGIEFDLDPATRRTLAARATSEGGFQLFVTDYSKTNPILETRLKGRTSLGLLAAK
ncbi:MAG: hypothetical protein KIS66_01220 [Fimbriimonadaceae bacterium]|nr:hypothetical protein [Fimbriimonadaceae bacterium]